MNLFELDDYKLALKEMMTDRRKQFGSRFTFERMAEACGVQKTYLSKVLNSTGQLNPDQLFSACEYLKLGGTETDFLLLLREYQLALNPKRAGLLKARIEKARSANLKTEAAIKVVPDDTLERNNWEYYTDIDLQLVHLFMTVPSFAEEPRRVCEGIGISEARLEAILLKLQTWKLIEYKAGKYKAKDPKLHLPESSPVFLAFGILQRIKTIERLRQAKVEKGDDYFFSVLFSAETKLQARLKRKFLDLLKEVQAEVIESPAQQVYQLNIDLFRWS
jgi:transcriptional regulator with XRE-family HTH domain